MYRGVTAQPHMKGKNLPMLASKYGYNMIKEAYDILVPKLVAGSDMNVLGICGKRRRPQAGLGFGTVGNGVYKSRTRKRKPIRQLSEE